MLIALIAAAMTSMSQTPPEIWACRNQIEVWCSVDGCAARAEEETTPLDIRAQPDNGRFSICAYSGCWEGRAEVSKIRGRLLFAADDVAFEAASGGFNANVTLLIVQKDGVGFVRVGGFATPLLCLRVAPAPTNN